MDTRKVHTRSPFKSDFSEGNLPSFDISGKKFGSNSDLDSCQSSPSFPKRRRVMLDEMSISSALSSQVSSCMSSRSHSPSLSECTLDDSILSTPGNSPSSTLKEQIKRRYSKYELLTSIESDYKYLMDKEIIEACKPEDGDEDLGENKVSLAEFRQQYQELTDWLSQVQQVMQRTLPGASALSEKYLNQNYHEELLKQSPRHKLFNDYAAQLEERYPRMKEEITQRLHHLNSQWEAVEQAVSCKDLWENTDMMVKDLQTDLKCLHNWLDETENRLHLMSLQSLQPSFNDDLIQESLLKHQSLQKDIEAHSRHVSAVLKLSERLQDEFINEYPDQHSYHRSAQNLQQRWHGLWLQSLEERCKLENALKKKPSCSTGLFLTGWIPSSFQDDHNRTGGSTSDDSFGLIPRQADIAESPQISDSSYSVSPKSGNNSGKDSAVVSEVECKMSSECSDSELDMMRKNRLRFESRDIGYSSGTSASPITTGHTSTESECDDIKKLIDRAEVLVSGKQSPSKQKQKVYSSCDASSEESDGKGEYSTASDNDGEDLFDSVLGLDCTSDTTPYSNSLPRFCDTVKLRKYKQRKDRPWSVIQFTEQDKFDITDLSKSETAIDRLNYGPDSPKRMLNDRVYPGTFPRIGAKRKLCLYESSFTEDVCAEQDSDTESSTSDEYQTANTEQSELDDLEEEDAGVASTTSFSEPTWDNYHQLTVYTSLGEDQEEPLHWTPLDEDLEFDDVFPNVKRSSLIAGAIDSKKKKEIKVKTKGSQRAGYDSDSDLEDLIYFIDDSASQLKFTDKYLKKKGKDPFCTGIDINTNKYAEIIATCETNIRCLQNVHMHLDTEATEEETERIREILYQWEKLHAFATERQIQSHQLSLMCKCLEDVQSQLQECDFKSPKSKFKSLEEVETYLKNAQIHQEILLILEKKVQELEEKTASFIQEHPAINLEVFQKQQQQAELDLKEKIDRVSTDLPHLKHIHTVWSDYNKTRQDLEQLLTVEKGNLEKVAVKLETEGSGAVLTLDLQGHIDTLMKYEEKMAKLQNLRGQLINVMDDKTRDNLTLRLAEIHDELYAVQSRCRQLLQDADPENMEHMAEQNRKMMAANQSSSSSSSSTSWLKSRYVHAAAVFMVLGIAYLVNPNAISGLGVTITPELRYVNGPPPM